MLEKKTYKVLLYFNTRLVMLVNFVLTWINFFFKLRIFLLLLLLLKFLFGRLEKIITYIYFFLNNNKGLLFIIIIERSIFLSIYWMNEWKTQSLDLAFLFANRDIHLLKNQRKFCVNFLSYLSFNEYILFFFLGWDEIRSDQRSRCVAILLFSHNFNWFLKIFYVYVCFLRS